MKKMWQIVGFGLAFMVVGLILNKTEPVALDLGSLVAVENQTIDAMKAKDLEVPLELKSGLQITLGETSFFLSDTDQVALLLSELYKPWAEKYGALLEVTLTPGLEILVNIESEADTLLEIGTLETLTVTRLEGPSEAMTDVASALAVLREPSQAQSAYVVQPGDVPSVIAQQFQMGLSELYALNPGLEAKATRLKIGESIIIQDEKFLANVYVVVEDVYEESIPKSFTYVEDPEAYLGSQSTLAYGSNGVKTVVARMTLVGDTTLESEIIDEVVITDPQAAVISRGTRALPPKGSIGTFVYPVEAYRLTSGFGLRWNRAHRGVDLAVPTGTTVMASDGGVITRSEWNNSYGYFVEIDHGDGVKTRYAHNSKLLVTVGETVSQYEVIALSGDTGNSTGPHVHFEIIIDDVWVNPLDYLE